MAKNKRLLDEYGLSETKGSFQIRGIINGCDKDTFYKEGKTKTQNDYRSVNFGVEYEKNKNWYIELMSMPRDNVYLFEKNKKKDEKGKSKPIAWAERFSYDTNLYNLIGVRLGLNKVKDSNGKVINENKTLTEFDACKYISDNLKDDASVFVKGKISYESYVDEGTIKRKVKFLPNQISLTKNEIDLLDEKFESTHDFEQVIVFIGIEQEKENDKNTGRYLVQAKIVTYATIEDAEFIIVSSKLANLFRKNLKPYTAIKVWGNLESSQKTEDVESDTDTWGEENKMVKMNNPVKRELIITGASKSSVDTKTYSEDKMNKAIIALKNKDQAKKDFGSSYDDTWGTIGSSLSDDDDDVWDD